MINNDEFSPPRLSSYHSSQTTSWVHPLSGRHWPISKTVFWISCCFSSADAQTQIIEPIWTPLRVGRAGNMATPGTWPQRTCRLLNHRELKCRRRFIVQDKLDTRAVETGHKFRVPAPGIYQFLAPASAPERFGPKNRKKALYYWYTWIAP